MSWLLTPCRRERVGEVARLAASLGISHEKICVVTTRPDTIKIADLRDVADHLVVFEKPGMLFGEWFNAGLDYISTIEKSDSYEILLCGSSLRCSRHTIAMLTDAIRLRALTMAGPDLYHRLREGQVETQGFEDVRTLGNRIPAVCFMVPGELGLRFDTDFRWWYSDDDLEMQARKIGPVGLVGGAGVVYPQEHALSEVQKRWAVEDRVKFVSKWGREPW